MSDAVDRFLVAAQAVGAAPQIRRFSQGTRTARDAAAAIGCDVAQIVKSLVFMADGTAILALTAGDDRADVERLAELAGVSEVRRATAEEARAATGFAVGGTPPFGHPTPVRALCDEHLLQHEVVWAAAGTPDSVFPLTPADLVRWSEAEVASFGESSRP
jgi:prolyl-tRNA editing enzyme YbaK/EbsC (Cys-tRNA(Pro) deacylase)